MTAAHGLDTPAQVFFYEHEFYVLSNFAAFQINWKGLMFPTSEHAYHWEKFARTNHPDIAMEIRFALSAHEALKIAEKMRTYRRADWDELDAGRPVKVNIMKAILIAKVGQHEYVRRKLMETGERVLIENSWRDSFWGWGPDQRGENWLGKLWMEIRDELREGRSS